jgi:hypothetical protein
MLLSPHGQQTKRHFRSFKFQHLLGLIVVECADDYCPQVEGLNLQVDNLGNTTHFYINVLDAAISVFHGGEFE